MSLLTLAFATIGGYALDILLGLVILKVVLKSNDASVQSLGFFELVHNAVSFGAGLFLGLSIISLSVTSLGISIAFMAAWFVVSVLLAKKILALTLKKAVTFLAVDTVFDYGIGGLASVPAGLSLLSVVGAPTSSTGTTPLTPLSLRPLTILVGLAFVVGIIVYDRFRDKPVELIAEEEG